VREIPHEARCAEREEQMLRSIFTPGIETQAPNKLTHANRALLSEAERVSLQLFVVGLGDQIVEDTSLFTITERKWLAFLRWLYAHGKLLH